MTPPAEDTRKTYRLQIGLVERIRLFIGTDKKYGYASELSFVEDAVRRRVEDLEREERMTLQDK